MMTKTNTSLIEFEHVINDKPSYISYVILILEKKLHGHTDCSAQQLMELIHNEYPTYSAVSEVLC